MTITISDKAKAVTALVAELDSISESQLNVAGAMAQLLMQQGMLSQRSAALHKALKELLK